MKDYEKGKKDYDRYFDSEVKPQKSVLPYVIFLVALFLISYLFFNNYLFA